MVNELLKKQKDFFKKGYTSDIDFRLNSLGKLRKSIQYYEKDILEALQVDLGKPHFEGYATEVGYVLDSISYMEKNLKKWTKDKKVKTPIHQALTKSFIRYEPYGTVLIIGPFNYPFQLIIEPMIGAIAAGNTVILKPSQDTVKTEAIIKRIINEVFEEEYISVITGGREVTSELINSKFDYIFFTGSVPVGKIVMEAASKNLVPVTLELGGKSPVIVHKDSNLDKAAKRIMWGKFINTGQTCVAPDYVYIHKDIKDELLQKMKEVLIEFYGDKPKNSEDYGKIVNTRQFDRLVTLIDEDKVFYGGNYDREELYIEPTILNNVTWMDKVMEDEIFGPILPVMEYGDINKVIDIINSNPKPLSFYIFSENERIQNMTIDRISFGGGCINDTISHVATPYMPFGGVGNSGIGSYHGEYSFYTFSHAKSIIKKSTIFDLNLIFPPYKDRINILKKVLK
ncbi:aldehyde dehydrogenase [Sporosalibacterium faouarense]|uniref:aldehyde dehydrogenase n=1 Tax=Sporosalibacterium faouarense TaxID=516123 RepID=UPI00141C1344|nr:aldehyde dehydrogenase [Sporosalibacterium faouarense]MTI46387.1 aldehyde dehydrogenase [Bacillota bacterium]